MMRTNSTIRRPRETRRNAARKAANGNAKGRLSQRKRLRPDYQLISRQAVSRPAISRQGTSCQQTRDEQSADKRQADKRTSLIRLIWPIRLISPICPISPIRPIWLISPIRLIWLIRPISPISPIPFTFFNFSGFPFSSKSPTFTPLKQTTMKKTRISMAVALAAIAPAYAQQGGG